MAGSFLGNLGHVDDVVGMVAFQDLTLEVEDDRKVFLADSDHRQWVVAGSASDALGVLDRVGSTVRVSIRSVEGVCSADLAEPTSDVRSMVLELRGGMPEVG